MGEDEIKIIPIKNEDVVSNMSEINDGFEQIMNRNGVSVTKNQYKGKVSQDSKVFKILPLKNY